MRLARLLMLGTAIATLAFMAAPMTFATSFPPGYSGTLVCISPASCAGGSISANGPGSTVTAYYWLRTNAPSGTTMNYYVCPTSAASCSSNMGTDNGWSWTFTPASGTTGTSPSCSGVPATSCEGNGDGSPGTLALAITAPSLITSSNTQERLTIYACSVTGVTQTCASSYQQVASASITASVPQFALGIGLAMAAAFVGLVLIRKSRSVGSIGTTSINASL